MPNLTPEEIEARRPKVVSLKHQPAIEKETDDDEFFEMCARVCYHYNQYTLEEVLEMRPNVVKLLLVVAQKIQAEQNLVLNAIINGPKAKNQSAYKNAINSLSKMAKQ